MVVRVASEQRRYSWRSRPLLGIALLLVTVGYAQFSPAAILADVAEHFGERGAGDGVAAQAGLSGTVLGVGLAIVRVARWARSCWRRWRTAAVVDGPRCGG